MGNLLLPVGPRRMSSWAAHQRRTPKSTEPGTDFYCPIGTPVLAPADGVIYGYGESITPPTGRWIGVDLETGQRWRSMHHKSLRRHTGRVRRGEVIAISGASGYGKEDWSADPNTGGAHTHVTLWPGHFTKFGYDALGRPYTIDFMEHADLGGIAGGEEDDDMFTDADRNMLATIAGFIYAGGTSVSNPDYEGMPGTVYNLLKQPVHRTEIVDGVPTTVKIPQIQDNADTNTMVRELLDRVKALEARLEKA